MKEVRCWNCEWVGTLSEAWDAATSVQYVEGEDNDGLPLYEEDNAFRCPQCHKETLEVFENGKRLGSMR